MLRKITIFLIVLAFLSVSVNAEKSSSSINWLSSAFYYQDACRQNMACNITTLNVINQTSIQINTTTINATEIYKNGDPVNSTVELDNRYVLSGGGITLGDNLDMNSNDIINIQDMYFNDPSTIYFGTDGILAYTTQHLEMQFMRLHSNGDAIFGEGGSYEILLGGADGSYGYSTNADTYTGGQGIFGGIYSYGDIATETSIYTDDLGAYTSLISLSNDIDGGSTSSLEHMYHGSFGAIGGDGADLFLDTGINMNGNVIYLEATQTSYIYDNAGDLTLVDANAGSKTLTELSSGGSVNGTDINVTSIETGSFFSNSTCTVIGDLVYTSEC